MFDDARVLSFARPALEKLEPRLLLNADLHGPSLPESAIGPADAEDPADSVVFVDPAIDGYQGLIEGLSVSPVAGASEATPIIVLDSASSK